MTIVKTGLTQSSLDLASMFSGCSDYSQCWSNLKLTGSQRFQAVVTSCCWFNPKLTGSHRCRVDKGSDDYSQQWFSPKLTRFGSQRSQAVVTIVSAGLTLS